MKTDTKDTGAIIDEHYETNYGEHALSHFRADNPFVIQPAHGRPVLRVVGSDDFTIDSLDRLEFVMALEDLFDIEINEDEALDLVKRSDVIKFVDEKVAAKKAA